MKSLYRISLSIFILCMVLCCSLTLRAATSYTVTNSKAYDANNNALVDGSGSFYKDDDDYYFVYAYKGEKVNAVDALAYANFLTDYTTDEIYSSIDFDSYIDTYSSIVYPINVNNLPLALHDPLNNVDCTSFSQINILSGYWTIVTVDRAKGYVSLEDLTTSTNLPDGLGKFSLSSMNLGDPVYKFTYYDSVHLVPVEPASEYYIKSSEMPEWLYSSSTNPLNYTWVSVRYGQWTKCEVETKISTLEADVYISLTPIVESYQVHNVAGTFFCNFNVPIDQVIRIDFRFTYQTRSGWFWFWTKPKTITTSIDDTSEYCSDSSLLGFCREGALTDSIQYGPFTMNNKTYDYKFVMSEDLIPITHNDSFLGFTHSSSEYAQMEAQTNVSIDDDVSIVKFSYFYNDIKYEYDEEDIVVKVSGNDTAEAGKTFIEWFESIKTKTFDFVKLIKIVLYVALAFIALVVVLKVVGLTKRPNRYKKNYKYK